MKRHVGITLLAFAGVVISGQVLAKKDYEDYSRSELRAMAEQSRKSVEETDGWQTDKVAVDEGAIKGAWSPVPFQPRYFDYPPEKLKAKWGELTRAIRVPFPSADYLQERIERFPLLKEELGPDFDGDYEALSQQILHTWRLFFRGDFRDAKDYGAQLGAFGKLPAYLAQSIQALYLTESREKKLDMLQDVANQIADYVDVLKEMKEEPRFKEDYMVLRLGYAFAIGRLAEEATPLEALRKNYLFKVSNALDDAVDIDPDHPVALAMQAAKDANIIRVVGKLLGRLTFGARLSRVEDGFAASFQQVDDLAIVHYEYANSLIYVNRNRDIYRAFDQFNTAIGIHPKSAMEALDSMYAAKRFKEIQDYYLNYKQSFRSFERERREYMEVKDENLYNVLKPPFLVSEYIKRKEEGHEFSMVD
ncbi:MAG: hypothetical protein ACPH3N_08585 [Alcanivorax sediminis]|uniref:Uncharacterized protein n=1 Tax=Alcanivorax sediminis TaxID=2663008 RepID=A0A6N7LV90_9GAMM|nr:hypothetical protein [Alcanivorax sediminis]MQX54282.1 hypothetical protein [Alcanivorax sediminis]